MDIRRHVPGLLIGQGLSFRERHVHLQESCQLPHIVKTRPLVEGAGTPDGRKGDLTVVGLRPLAVQAMAKRAAALEDRFSAIGARGGSRLGHPDDSLTLEVEAHGCAPGDPEGISDKGLHCLAVHRGRGAVEGEAEAALDALFEGVDLMVLAPVARIGAIGPPEWGGVGLDSPVEMTAFAGEVVSDVPGGVLAGMDEDELSLSNEPSERSVGKRSFCGRGEKLKVFVP